MHINRSMHIKLWERDEERKGRERKREREWREKRADKSWKLCVFIALLDIASTSQPIKITHTHTRPAGKKKSKANSLAINLMRHCINWSESNVFSSICINCVSWKMNGKTSRKSLPVPVKSVRFDILLVCCRLLLVCRLGCARRFSTVIYCVRRYVHRVYWVKDSQGSFSVFGAQLCFACA